MEHPQNKCHLRPSVISVLLGINHKSIHACVVPGGKWELMQVALNFPGFLTCNYMCRLVENHLEHLCSLPIAMFEGSLRE